MRQEYDPQTRVYHYYDDAGNWTGSRPADIIDDIDRGVGEFADEVTRLFFRGLVAFVGGSAFVLVFADIINAVPWLGDVTLVVGAFLLLRWVLR